LTSGKLSGRASIDHQFTDDIMGYISYNRGFKSGTFNTIVIPLPAAFSPSIPPAVRPETLDDYSIGEKAEFFDHRLRLNTEAFYYTYRNIQINEILAGVSYLSNAAAATIKGVDVNATIVPVDGLTLTAGVELLDGHYTSYPNGLLWVYDLGPCASNCTQTANLAGNKTIYTPPFSLNLTADYIYPTSVGQFDFTVAYNHGGDYFFDPDNGKGQISPSYDKQPALNIVNASVLWTPGSGMFDVRLWGKNITGVKYISFGDEDAFNTQYSPAPPATYGVTLCVHL
jgi:iron complex outermembrane recepter protein